MRGPRPQPVALKILKGNPGKRALNKREPKPPPGTPPKPPGLDKFEAEQWDWIISMMQAMRTISLACAGEIRVACSCWSHFMRASNFVASRKDLCFLSGKKGDKKMRRTYPELAQMQRARRDYLSALAELGLTTATRSRMKALPEPGSGEGGLDQYFKGGK